MRDVHETAPYQRYLEGLARGALVYQTCASCHKAIFYPRPGCPFCGALDLSLQDSKGLGTLYSVSVVYDKVQNYNLVLVDLDEGFRMMSCVPDCAAPAIGSRVKARLEQLDDQEPRIVFDLVEGDAA
ncbi:Zn-ribbon domain-containing OB-fold protein [Pseudomonas sp. 5P_3.1_Bac2]|uniref:Zn-ribbon domain-containing OB-fold protein n=1 Tax=Pseudomonas sp. 5P_3.1_Bac2 TaxID=2971617 RepID=UPI0021C63177|nr:zinc ribbon domain-containing protein [Pseudomonas sp. 5P_3.1_Bac2]MCU1717672.1 zinc ribbon domain-containing protein [Pseudomonas sp. 5P_3.1_Bac2]